ncbi:hypothetical protein BATDEDRAFT_34223 [Batrachochytrium dendrobatidis JAM81]|uniref:Host cell factor Kelch-repeats domain-containing protein n=1 Tax=Batrachochytrium dendrobatidis (strain JAM81 / FGSC 10211) TaxID=684364 RepID=F4NT19_BATDJ|nr:uncharacterized protein BATDEDRAFT_34223 [Batrachochytrium dendrobatidis JAM81]EGF84296.1 hypothetical protein BATDEDRAFT_34223 [Batrachochytrium dendrobatidis JAM81]|eukprot:XP_006675792.1 hypothetical protein BATDEDRAFT_34223 [Batrachochytrium dendrobatidis JAM81]
MTKQSKARWHLLHAPITNETTHETGFNRLGCDQPFTLDHIPKTNTVYPSARHGHACQYLSYMQPGSKRKVHELVLFWGGNYGISQDAFVLDLETRTWRPILSWKEGFKNNVIGKNDSLQQFQESINSVGTPSAASGSTSDEISKIYLFGGMQEDQEGDHITNGLYVYDAQKDKFETITSSNSQLPTPRFAASATYVPYNNESTTASQIYVFGGLGADHLPMSEFHAFDLKKSTWHLIKADGIPPTARESHTALFSPASHGNPTRIVIFGGFSGHTEQDFQRLNDIVYYNIDEQTWSRPDIQGFIPPGRSLHTSVMLNNKMIVFGGMQHRVKDTTVLNDSQDSVQYENNANSELRQWECSSTVFTFDLATETWESVEAEPAIHDQNAWHAPSPRSGHTAVMVGNMMIVVGGNLEYNSNTGSRQCTNDIWALEFGPPPPPGQITVTPSATSVSPLYSDNQLDGMPAAQFKWADEYSWIPNRSYRLEVQDRSNDPSTWRVLYEGVERSFIIPLVSSKRKSMMSLDSNQSSVSHLLPLDELDDSCIYCVRVLCINFAGDSLDWCSLRLNDTPPIVWIRNGMIIEDISLLPPSPTDFVAQLNTTNAFGEVSFSWTIPLVSLETVGVRLYSRAIVALNSMHNDADHSVACKHQKSQTDLQHTDSTVSKNDTETLNLTGNWQCVWEGGGISHQLTLTYLRDFILIPMISTITLDCDKTGLTMPPKDIFDACQTGDHAVLDMQLEDSVINIAGNKRSWSAVDHELTPENLLRCVNSLQYEFKICTVTADKEFTVCSDWSHIATLDFPPSVLLPLPTLPSSTPSSISLLKKEDQTDSQQTSNTTPKTDTDTPTTKLKPLKNMYPNLPELGNLALPFQYNLRFGDKIESKWVKFHKTSDIYENGTYNGLWYPARAIYYMPSMDGQCWRLKVHFEGCKKSQDQFISLIGETTNLIRLPLGGDGVAVPGLAKEVGFFDLDSTKTYILTKDQKEIARLGQCIIKNR